MASEKFSTKQFGSLAIFFLTCSPGEEVILRILGGGVLHPVLQLLIYFILPDHAIFHTCF